METKNDAKKIKVILLQSGKEAKVVEIDSSLESMQKIVGGYIEQYVPFDDDVSLICNEEGKIIGLPLNRAIYKSYDENSKNTSTEILDIISGDFFIAAAPSDSENFESLSDEQIEKYLKMFMRPQIFFMCDGEIKVVNM